MMKNATVQYEKRLVAFIDILGFKEIISNSQKDSSKIDLIYSVLTFLKNWEKSEFWSLKFVEVEMDAQKKGVSKFDIRGKTNTTAFSDSIVVSVKVEDDINEMVSTLIANLAYAGAILLEKGILIRGGLTLGDIIHESNGVVFGQGLIDAFMLETKNAKYPRIVLSDKLVAELNYPIDSKRDRYPYHQYIQRFEDGCAGIHQLIYFEVLQDWTEMTPELLEESLEKARKVIVSGLDSSFERPEIYQKYFWLKEQYNNLIILSDFDYESQTEENVKQRIRNVNDNISGHNIHFGYTDEFYEYRRKNKLG